MSKGLIRHILSNNRLKSIAAIIFGLIVSLAAVLSTLQIGRAIDFMVGAGNVDFSSISTILIMLSAIYLLDSLSSFLVSKLSVEIAFTTATDLRRSLFGKLSKLPLAYFDKRSHGDILSNFTSDVDNISSALSASLTHLITGISTVTLLLFVMFISDYRLAIIVVLMAPFTFLLSKLVTNASQSSFNSQQEQLGAMTGFISEKVGNQKTINALNNQKETLAFFETINSRYRRISTKANFAAAMVNPSTRIVDHFSYLFVGVVGAFLALNGNLSIGTISTFLIFTGQFSKPFNELSSLMGQIQTASSSLARVRRTLAKKEEAPDHIDAKIVTNPIGKVEFENVGFSYNKKTPLIKGLSFKANSGDLIAIVGPTGAGKTTIVNLIMRFYEIDSGAILLDDSDINMITKESLRKSFGMVLQDSWLFKGTIGENIAYGMPNASKDEIRSAAKSAYIANFIESLPDKYDFSVEEGGANLSQGERQLITIARVMLTNPSMLILDEATSSIDTLTEIRVQKAFLKLMENRTSFVIAHRLSTIEKATSIIVLDKGSIVEIGSHAGLIGKKGFYYDLYMSQYK